MKVRSIFVSDVHLGTRGCQAERLLEFLREHEAQYLYLVGDIVDFWAMRRGIHWTPAQNTVVQKILRRARHGEHVMLIPGNHDEALREYDGVSFGQILVRQEHVHVTADGRRFLLLHGDEFDQVTRHHRWLAILGDVGYDALVRANALLARLRRLLRRPGYWSLAGYAKSRVKRAVSFIFCFEDSVIHAVRARGLDGVICGHIHSATIQARDGLTYANCGDWVDSCTAIVEHLDGRLELIRAWQPVPLTVPGAAAQTRPQPEPVAVPSAAAQREAL
ncbi:MAG: UDP-2,3-diacylglucosamine diphosphatase [Candidatus Accumulibacter sp.]|nr:UDP-2,3-diacylglucosamine diphosphatase [Candidatus Accumulibacter conexus]